MTLEIRKMCKFVDTTYIEDFKKCEEPVELISVAAVITNPWVDQGYVEDLKPAILDIAPKLGDFLVAELLNEIGSPDKVLAYGKASMTGMRGSIQHASALIHTLHFGNKFRDAVGGTSYLSFTNVRGLAASKMSIPMMHKTDPGLRQFYLTHEFTIRKGIKVEKAGEIGDAIQAGIEAECPTVIDVQCSPDALYSFRQDSFKHKVKQ